MRATLTYLICSFLLCVVQAGASSSNQRHDFYFTHLKVEDGLSQNMIYSILQDKQGFMWFGTQDGLNRYDGHSTKVYKRDLTDPKSIGSNSIFSLMEDNNGLIWVGTLNGIYIYNPVYDSFTFFDHRTEKGKTVNGIVRSIDKDPKGNIWFIVSDMGAYCFTPDQVLKEYLLDLNDDAKIGSLREFCFDAEGNPWIATYRNGIYCIRIKENTVEQFLLSKKSNSTSANDANDIFFLNTGALLIATVNKGVQMFDLKTSTFSSLLENTPDGKPLFVRRIFQDKKGLLWFGTETGMIVYNMQTRKEIWLQHTYNNPYTLSDNAIHSIYQDREEGMWLGTFFGGVNYFIESSAQFKKFYPVKGENSISGKSISEFCEDDRNRIWIGTEDAGLNRYDPSTDDFTSDYIPPTNIHALLYENGNLWVGTFADGLYVLNTSDGSYKVYRSSLDKCSLNSDNIYSIYKDYSGDIWIGTVSGLHRYDAGNNCFIQVHEKAITAQVNDISEDYMGKIWFATLGNGVFLLDKSKDAWIHYPSVMEEDKGKGNMVSCLLEDSRNNLWFGTEGAGLSLYDQTTGTFTKKYTIQNGLPNDVIYQLLEDGQGFIWGSTNKGLFMLDPSTGEISTYTHSNGLLGDQFNYKSGLKSKDGRIYFGGVKGFTSFLPGNLQANTVKPNVVLNSFQIYNDEKVTDEQGEPLKQSITYTRKIRLPHNATFSIGFAALSYVSPQANKYAYKLEGRDKDWIFLEHTNQVTYANLPSGDYLLKVKASNSDGLWNDEGTSLQIKVMPPFYQTTIAYISYGIILLLFVYWILKKYTERVEQRNAQLVNALEIRKEKELYHAKIEFFTHVTHEIRTPLSLIKAPLEEIMKYVKKNDENWENLTIIQRNTNRLLKLVNELLDFRKTETQGLKLNYIRRDVSSLVTDSIERFRPSAELKGIRLSSELPPLTVVADIDAEIVTKIISNLLNNALKYASSRVNITLTTSEKRIKIIVSNNGNKIPNEYAQKIFEPFFKLNETTEGSGLGLPFARSLAELHNGAIYVDTSAEETTFVVELPVNQENVIRLADNGQTSPGQHINGLDAADLIPKDHPVILSVEDNEEFQQFMIRQLKGSYQILKASDGKQALGILSKEHVDIVISDIMMPVMDGMNLCKEIKENLRFSHIPVILLTAKTALQTEIEGLKTGADEYIVKPYSIDYLRARIENLLENRKKIKESYRNSPDMTSDSIVHSKADKEFLHHLIEAILQHMEDTELDVDKLAAIMNMSRATLYRKVKSISELTPNDFIRLIRLKKAVQLLHEKEYRINEISYIVGFSSPSYFAKCFYKQFGMLPKEYQKSMIVKKQVNTAI